MREAWKRETYARCQSFSSESAVKYLHVRRRKIQISPPLVEQDRSNALPQGQQRQSNPHPMPYKKKIIAVKDATSALAKKRPEKIQSCRGLNLKPLKKEINKKINKYQEDHPGKTDFFQAFFSQLHIYMLHIFIISRDY